MRTLLLRGGWAGLVVALLAGCQANTTPGEETKTAQPVTLTTAPIAPKAPAAPYWGYHRYRGTVGGQPVVVELTLTPATKASLATCTGSYYYERHGRPLALQSPAALSTRAPLALTETASEGQPATAHWQAQTPTGPTLLGTWTSADGKRQLPLALREDYTGAVRYGIVSLATPRSSDPAAAEEMPLTYHSDSLTTEFLHLLGPDTLRPALRKLQCPAPAQRRAEAEEASADSYLSVTLNGYGLLSLLRWESEEIGGAYPDNHRTPYTYDLATGRACDPRAWLAPGQEIALRQLLTRHMLADSMATSLFPTPGTPGMATKPYLAPLPHFGLNTAGFYCTLEDFGAPHVIQGVEVTIPYAELQPLLRPDSPVARMLRTRGLWHEAKKQ